MSDRKKKSCCWWFFVLYFVTLVVVYIGWAELQRELTIAEHTPKVKLCPAFSNCKK